ncbi:hypothetical protein LTS17_004672 [Exophiala oligosperma]
MSSQRTDFPPVSFSARYPQKSLRLLELPHELVATIEEGRKIGSATRMQLKSSSTSQGYLHLCTNDKMWAVKQVSTSNSVYVTESTGAGGEPRSSKRRKIEHEKDEEEMDVDQQQDQKQDDNGEVTAISQVKNILELIHVDTDAIQLEAMVRDMLPLYHNDDDDDDADVERYSKGDRYIRIEDMLHDIPAPDKVILDAARKLFVFGLSIKGDDHERVTLCMPTSSLLLRAWKSLMQTYTLSSFKSEDWNDVKGWLGPVLADMKRNIDDETESALLTSVAMASLRRFAIFQEKDLNCRQSPLDTFTTMPPETVGWDGSGGCAAVGKWLLESLYNNNKSNTAAAAALSVEDFKQQWEQILPDSWAKDCDVVSLIKSSSVEVEIVTDGQGTEVLKFPTITAHGDLGRVTGVNKSAGIAGAAGTTATAAVNDAKAQKKRKWHEKFGAQRNPAMKK